MPGSVTARLYVASPDSIDLRSAVARLRQMDHDERTCKRPRDTKVYAIASQRHAGLGLWTLRQGVDLHRAGEIKPWDLDADVAEGSYFRFFEDGVTVMLATGHGPRTTALGEFLQEVFNLDMFFDAILRIDNVHYIASLDEVKRIEMTLVGQQVATELRRVDDTLGDAAASLFDASGDKVKITFDGTDKDSRNQMWGRANGQNGWFRRLVDELPIPGLGRLHVVIPGEFSGEEDLDVLKDKITYQMEVPSSRLDLTNAMDVAARAYDRYRNE